MYNKYCKSCGTPLQENVLFCPVCGTKNEAVPGTKQAGGTEYPNAVPPAEPVYTKAPPKAPGPSTQQPEGDYTPYGQTGAPGNPMPPPVPPAGGYTYTGYQGDADTGDGARKKEGRGLLIGGILGLVALAVVIAAVVLTFGERPAHLGGSTGASIQAAAEETQDTNTYTNSTAPSTDTTTQTADTSIKTDATLYDICGLWEGEMSFTRMDGFDQLPADTVPENMDEMIAEILSGPAPMTLGIEEDGSWELDIDIVTGMMFDSNDGYNDDTGLNPLQLTGLDDGVFNISFNEEMEEGTGALAFTGTVHENSGGLYLDGIIRVSMLMDNVTVVEEGSYTVTLTEPANVETYEEEPGEAVSTDAAVSAAVPDGSTLSTAERPELLDFDWYVTDVFLNGIPDDALIVVDYSDVLGSWKGFIFYDPYNKMDAYGFDLLNIEIDGYGEDAMLLLDWYSYYSDYDQQIYDISGTEDSIIEGSYVQGLFQAGEPGYRFYITKFYYLDGAQYAVGYVQLESGEETYLALVRP